jgi:RHS repeat-associated protein
MEMTGRNVNSNYRYGFNGKEKDSEFQNNYDYGFRIYNAKIAKFLSVDPLIKKYPELTPYQFASNTPISAIDLDGLEGVVATNLKIINTSTGIKITGAIELKLKVINLSSKDDFELNLNDAFLEIKDFTTSNLEGPVAVRQSFYKFDSKTGSWDRNSLKDQTVEYDFSIKVSVEQINNLSQAKDNDFIFAIVDDIGSTFKDAYGQEHNTGGFVNKMGGSVGFIKTSSWLNLGHTNIHEWFHVLGLGDIEAKNNVKELKKRLMWHLGGNTGNEVTALEKTEILDHLVPKIKFPLLGGKYISPNYNSKKILIETLDDSNKKIKYDKKKLK